jgi:hypothetical protein
MAATIKLIDKRIIHMVETGILDHDALEATTKARIQFAAEHIDGIYVIIYDVTGANLDFFNMLTSKWSLTADENMIGVVGIGVSTTAQVGMKLFSRLLTDLELRLVDTFDEALVEARAIIAAALKKRGLSE